ncbi:hypothetical protein DQ99_001068 [Salmonella enterica subsp. houtenae serovar 40:z4,z24:-]|uniref:Integrase n=1 Tax=Salmonella enterica subsp. VII serovar 40:z4,z24:[z39] TaxID=1967625 RepID=A0A731TAS0_SALEE|nr:hypothetical protein [Salmonella enterica]EDS6438377.1 hypothetical protein [Salmonella enterica subsp. VII str. CFSAN000550]EDT6887145.1 hypothetical protein [Salmonella enterica subsp. enterica]EDU6340683.1 hypothetical protein [Salmonella enterica subsp. houtenae serovar 40:z4,z24:-]EDU7900239.1 hypothetical protein [Salmonella enterica subsp. houtenae]HAE4732038.1 hypothetical protein [Salmonella enterica subsp. VII serovar 40:z4,z24:[z39]]
MDKIIFPILTVKQIKAAKPKEKPYQLLDDNALYLYVPVRLKVNSTC